MLLQALLSTVPVRGELDRVALAVHSTMLEHGFICVGSAGPTGAVLPVLTTAADGSVSMQVVPAGWNAVPDSYTFGYVHPLRGSQIGAGDTFTVKALAIGGNLAVHAASSVPGADLLTLSLNVNQGATDNDPVSVVARAKDWQEKVSAGIAMRLLGRQNSTARLGKALEAQPESSQAGSSGSGTKRPAPEEPRNDPRPGIDDEMFRPDFPFRPFPGGPGNPNIIRDPFRDPFTPGFFRDENPFNPRGGGNLLGPRHPAWGQVVPGRFTGGGMMPRFDPIMPGMGEPDPDHLPVPGLPPQGRRMDPDGMFMM
eukprot:TRINITY_DN23471_c1_g1_i2.p1 TRINITY_DN23471_c1_g1~~TRINITY_DN23471_c1_g1_i2.p1  ORF type:complete len:311 (-),score=56.97 TRINITY_DN23471_c1_g1_i2:149-1081(-)